MNMKRTMYVVILTFLLTGVLRLGAQEYAMISQPVQPEKARTDSLKRVLPQKKANSRDRLEVLTHLAETYLRYLPDSSLRYANQALKLAVATGDREGMAINHLILGQVFANFSAFSTALEHYLEAQSLFQINQDVVGLARTHNAKGDLMYFTRQMGEALKEHQAALEISRTHGLNELEAKTLGYIGHFYEKQLDYPKALNYQQLALQRYQELENPEGLAAIYGNLGSIYEDLEQFDEAYRYFSLALEYNLRTPNEEDRIIHLNNLGDIFRKRHAYEAALEYTNQALALAEKLENTYQMKSARRDLAKIYASMGAYEQAFRQLDLAYELNDTLYDTEGTTQIARMQSLYEMNRTQRELDNLKEEQRVGRIVRWALIGGLVLLIALFGVIVNRQRLKSRKDKELFRAQQALTQQALENSQLREKQLEADLEARAAQLSAHALSIVQKNKILKDVKTQLTHLRQQDKSLKTPVKQMIHKIDHSFHFDKDWKKFNQIFEQVHPEFYRKLNEQFPELSAAEIRLCALLRLNLAAKDIASILGISADSLRVSRYRLRKKLGLDRQTHLVAFIMKI